MCMVWSAFADWFVSAEILDVYGRLRAAGIKIHFIIIIWGSCFATQKLAGVADYADQTADNLTSLR